MHRSTFHSVLAVGFLLFASSGFASVQKNVLTVEASQLTDAMRATAMPQLDNSRVGGILNRYYNEGLGGAENWEQIGSLRVAGVLTLESGEFSFTSMKKKPDLTRMVIHAPGRRRDLMLGYDGTIAWIRNPHEDGGPQSMEDAAARRFIHTAHFGSHLLYPFAKGKNIAYIDTVPLAGRICHHLQVTLDTGFIVDYYIDIRTHLEVRVVSTDTYTGDASTVMYDDYTFDYDIPIARKITNHENGEWVSTLVLQDVKLNTGLMPWMFKMPEKKR